MKTKKGQNLTLACVIALLMLEGCYYNGVTPTMVGSWNLVSVVYSGCYYSEANGSTTCSSNCLHVFTSATITNASSSINYKLSGDKITINSFGGIRQGTYTISGNTLVITFQDSVVDGGCKEVVTFTK